MPDATQEERGYTGSRFLFDAMIPAYTLGLGLTIWPRQKG